MIDNSIGDPPKPGPTSLISFDSHEFPWWLVGMVSIIVSMGVAIVLSEGFNEAFRDVIRGIGVTFGLTAGSFVVSMVLGLFLGLGRISGLSASDLDRPSRAKTVIRNLSTLYIEFVRGIPMIVFIFLIALVLAPEFADLINLESRAISNAVRAGAALSLFYAAFIAEVFRAGIQSVSVGTIEAGRAVGLTENQIMRKVILPQAVRNMLPALGNDLISLMKDTSLASVLAVREITQMARLYTGSTFRFREGFFVLVVIYVTMTLSLSLLLRWYEKRIAIPGR